MPAPRVLLLALMSSTTDASSDPRDPDLARALAEGDEAAFECFVAEHHPSLVRFARSLGAREKGVVALAWTDFIARLPEPAPSLKSALYRAFIERWRQVTDARLDEGSAEPAVASDRFHPTGHRWGGWIVPPSRFPGATEDARRALQSAISALPATMRAVLLLRDGEGLDEEEAAFALGLDEAAQRRLLHLARSRARAALEAHYAAGGAS